MANIDGSSGLPLFTSRLTTFDGAISYDKGEFDPLLPLSHYLLLIFILSCTIFHTSGLNNFCLEVRTELDTCNLEEIVWSFDGRLHKASQYQVGLSREMQPSC